MINNPIIKGKEYFWNDLIVPSELIDPTLQATDHIKDARNLIYVALTRAKYHFAFTTVCIINISNRDCIYAFKYENLYCQILIAILQLLYLQYLLDLWVYTQIS